MKATIYMATYNKNELLPNTLYSIARQKVSFPYEVCIVDDCSDVDPEPIIRQFIPDVKYKRFNERQGFDAVTTHVLDLASEDSEIIIMQSADIIHYGIDTIERLCAGVRKKTACMAYVKDTHPPTDLYKRFDEFSPELLVQWKKGRERGTPKRRYFFLGAMLISDYKTLKGINDPHCDIMLKAEMDSEKYKFLYPDGIIGCHQPHGCEIVPCKRLKYCTIKKCKLRDRCERLGIGSFDDYLGGQGVI